MAMTKLRKWAQNKLRRKYGYSTNTNYGRGTILYRKDNESYRNFYDKNPHTYDFNIILSNNNLYGIEIMSTKYIDQGEEAGKDRYKEDSTHIQFITLEELDLIHTIAHQMVEENKKEE